MSTGMTPHPSGVTFVVDGNVVSSAAFKSSFSSSSTRRLYFAPLSWGIVYYFCASNALFGNHMAVSSPAGATVASLFVVKNPVIQAL